MLIMTSAGGGGRLIQRYGLEGNQSKLFLEHKIFNGCLFLKLFKHSCIGDIRMNPEQWFLEDEPFVWKILQNINTVVLEDTRYYHWYLHQESLCNQKYSDKKISGEKYIADLVLSEYSHIINNMESNNAIASRALQFHFMHYYGVVRRIATYGLKNSNYEKEILSVVQNYGFKGFKYLNSLQDKVFLFFVLINYGFAKIIASKLYKSIKA